MIGLTRKQLDLFHFIRTYSELHGIAPTFEEMAAAVGLRSKSGIHRLLTGLEQRGWIVREPLLARSIRISDDAAALRVSFAPDVSRALRAAAASRGVDPTVIIQEAVAARVGCAVAA